MEVGFLLLCLVARLLYLPPSVCSNEVSSPSFYPRILLVKWSIIKRRQQLLSRVVRILHIQFPQWAKVHIPKKYRNYHLINPFKTLECIHLTSRSKDDLNFMSPFLEDCIQCEPWQSHLWKTIAHGMALKGQWI